MGCLLANEEYFPRVRRVRRGLAHRDRQTVSRTEDVELKLPRGEPSALRLVLEFHVLVTDTCSFGHKGFVENKSRLSLIINGGPCMKRRAHL